MGNSVVSKFAFQPPNPPSYTREDPEFQWIMSDSGYEIPILECIVNDDEESLYALYSHGNAEDLGLNRDGMQFMAAQLGVNLVAYDYTGYGPAVGTVSPNETRAYHDINTVFRHITETLGVPASRVVLMGRSLGTGPTCDLAARESDVAGVILLSPLLSAVRTQTSAPLGLVDIFQNIKKVPRIESPLLIVHGMLDRVVPFSHGERLHGLAQNPMPLVAVQDAGHNDLQIQMGQYYYVCMAEFIEMIPVLQESAARARQEAADAAASDSGSVSSSLFSSSCR